MKIIFLNVDEETRAHTTQGPKVRFDFVSAGGAAVRSMLSVGNIHIGYSTKDGAKFKTTRTLVADKVHGAAVMVSAEEVGDRRDYAFSIAINGRPVVSAAGNIPAGQPTDMDDRSFQLEVLEGELP
jgi:hypothetical protein